MCKSIVILKYVLELENWNKIKMKWKEIKKYNYTVTIKQEKRFV